MVRTVPMYPITRVPRTPQLATAVSTSTRLSGHGGFTRLLLESWSLHRNAFIHSVTSKTPKFTKIQEIPCFMTTLSVT